MISQRDLIEKPLSPRETQVLELVAEGLSNKLIATQLFISESTVHYHTLEIFKKLDVGNRSQAVAKGFRQGILK